MTSSGKEKANMDKLFHRLPAFVDRENAARDRGLSDDSQVQADATDTTGHLTTICIKTGTDPVAGVIYTFVKDEQARNFAFLGRDTHLYSKAEALAIYRTDPKRVEAICKKWSLDANQIKGVWFSFELVFHGLVYTVLLRCHATSTSPDATDGFLASLTDVAQLEALDLEANPKVWMDLRAWLRKTLE